MSASWALKFHFDIPCLELSHSGITEYVDSQKTTMDIVYLTQQGAPSG